MRRLLIALALGAVLSTSACDSTDTPGGTNGKEVDVSPPEAGICRVLDVKDIGAKSNDTGPVSCAKPHNAETYHVASFKGPAADLEYDDPKLGAAAYKNCQPRFIRFVGATQSLALRTVISWAWWRPTKEQWDAGARWFRCDVIGGSEQSEELVALPKTAKGVLLGIPGPRWMVCATGAEVASATRVPCTEKHDWRAVSAIVVGEPKDKWPGDRLVEVRTRDFCSDWVGAWMNYPLDYEYGYTWYDRVEWEAGNRMSVCWAKTAE